MRSLLVPALFALLVPNLVACSGDGGGDMFAKSQCNDDKDNDGDGDVDFPDDLGCDGEDDDTEDSMPSPQCMDGRDNDGDGKHDFPSDPGCFAPNQDDEEDDCPDGPSCPQCSNNKDDDGNGQTDYPNDSGGCASASDTDEYTRNPVACGSNVMIKMLPFDGHAMGTLASQGASNLVSPMCGGAGLEDVYEIRISTPKVLVATTDNGVTAANTVLYLRSSDCSNMSSEMVCNDDISTTNTKSSINIPLSTKGTYYLVVDSKDNTGGAYDLKVSFLTGEGEPCSGADDCGPGLVCRVPKGGTTKVCAKHVCDDTVDEDNDGKNGYPDDPGCTNKTDDDEADTCPAGPGCPECGDGVDNDGDGKTDFGTMGDTTCTSASNVSEACLATDGVVALTQAMTMDTTVGAVNDVTPSCGTSTAPDKTYRLDLPAMTSLTIENTGTLDGLVSLYNSTCTGTALQCKDEPEKLTFTNLAAGTYYYIVDGYSTNAGPYTINIQGKIQNGASCESALAQSGAISCNLGYGCSGTLGSRTCQPSLCLDAIDNDGDGKIDYPADPGCSDAADNSEQNPMTASVCSNMTDDDTDGMTDWPADIGCAAASGASEAFCTGEMDAASLITTKTTTGVTTGASNDQVPSCSTSSSAPDKSFALQLPVPVASLTINSTGFDTILSLKSIDCTSTVECQDGDEMNPFALPSTIVRAGVAPGGYAITVDGYSSGNGSFTLTVSGTVAPGTACSSPLFSGGANAVLACPTGTTCTGTPLKCQ